LICCSVSTGLFFLGTGVDVFAGAGAGAGAVEDVFAGAVLLRGVAFFLVGDGAFFFVGGGDFFFVGVEMPGGGLGAGRTPPDGALGVARATPGGGLGAALALFTFFKGGGTARGARGPRAPRAARGPRGPRGPRGGGRALPIPGGSPRPRPGGLGGGMSVRRWPVKYKIVCKLAKVMEFRNCWPKSGGSPFIFYFQD